MDYMTLNQINKLHAAPEVENYLKQNIKLYIDIARRVRVSFPEFSELDRIDIVSDMIKKTDKDVYGLDGKYRMSVDEICDLFARAAVGDELQQR